VDVEGSSVLSGCRDQARWHVPDRQFIAKIEMAMRWSATPPPPRPHRRCGRGGGGSEVWLHARGLHGCEVGCEVLKGHGAGGDEHEDKQSRRCRAPIVESEEVWIGCVLGEL